MDVPRRFLMSKGETSVPLVIESSEILGSGYLIIFICSFLFKKIFSVNFIFLFIFIAFFLSLFSHNREKE